jgi:3-oxoacyl-[acyl-carrier protein] reductase
MTIFKTKEARIMELKLKDKVALITGASRGIGAASSMALAHHGATVVINYIKSKDKAQELLDEIQKAGGKGMVFQADVRDQGAVKDMVESTLTEFGKIDVLVNNANINFPIRPFIELTWEQIETKILGEMKALYNCSQAILKEYIPVTGGSFMI